MKELKRTLNLPCVRNSLDSENSLKKLLSFSLIIMDKSGGPTSFQISQYVKKELNLNKTSHMGTLDPMVTGVLPITLNRACKLSQYFMGSDKEYVGIMRVHSNVSRTTLKSVMREFLGNIIQLPPVRSRVKRANRVRNVKRFEILEKKGKDFLFVANVQAGTYIRKLIHDLGKKIGGAHMLELRRTKASIFKEISLINLYEFDRLVGEYNSGNPEPLKSVLIPAENAIKKVLPVIEIKEKFVSNLLVGKPLMKLDVDKIEIPEKFAIFYGKRFIGAYLKKEEGDILARPEFVYN